MQTESLLLGLCTQPVSPCIKFARKLHNTFFCQKTVVHQTSELYLEWQTPWRFISHIALRRNSANPNQSICHGFFFGKNFSEEIYSVIVRNPTHQCKLGTFIVDKEKTSETFQAISPEWNCNTSRQSFCFEYYLTFELLTSIVLMPTSNSNEKERFCPEGRTKRPPIPHTQSFASRSYQASVTTRILSVGTAEINLGTPDDKRWMNSSKKNLSLCKSFQRLPSAKSDSTLMHRVPVLPYSCESANCMRPRSFWACLEVNFPSTRRAFKSVHSSSTRLSVFFTWTCPSQACWTSNKTPSASQEVENGTHLSPASAKSHPVNLKSATIDCSVFLAKVSVEMHMKSS